jgi:hypothetical protein
MAFPADPAEQLKVEQALLIKARNDIEDGQRRLRNQEKLLVQLQRSGRDTLQAERLVQLLKETLVEWERHRTLIAGRVAYLAAHS